MCGPKINPIASWEHKLFLKSSFQEFRMSRNICGLFLDFGNTAEMRNLLFTSPTCAASDCPNVFVALWVHFFEAPLKANRLGYMDDALQRHCLLVFRLTRLTQTHYNQPPISKWSQCCVTENMLLLSLYFWSVLPCGLQCIYSSRAFSSQLDLQ